MFEPFTDRARTVMALANQEALRLKHEYIGTEHILLGLVKEGSGVGANVLKNLGMDLAKVRTQVEILIKAGPDAVSGNLPQTPRAKVVIENAIYQARGLNHKFVGTEHLLLGLLCDKDSVAARVLNDLGVSLEACHAGVLKLLGAGHPDRTPDAISRAMDRHIQIRERKSIFERFTDRARKVMALANQEAQRLNHEFIGTEHILLGLVKEGSGVGANVLKNLEVDLRKIRLEIERLVKSGPDTVAIGKLPQTPRAKKVIEFAIEEARNLNHNYVGTEHILLGLLREKEGIAAKVLLNLGIKLDEVREEVLNLLGAGPEEPTGASGVVTTGETVQSASPLILDDLISVLLERFDSQISKLVHEKNECVKNADYEKAATLREEALAIIESKTQAILKILGYEKQS